MKQSIKSSHDTLSIKTGQVLNPGTLFRIFENGAHNYADTTDLFADKISLVFMGPAPFSRLDTQQATEYEQLSTELLKYVDVVYGIYCQDAFVMREFEMRIQEKAGSKNIQFWADGDGTFCQKNKLFHVLLNCQVKLVSIFLKGFCFVVLP